VTRTLSPGGRRAAGVALFAALLAALLGSLLLGSVSLSPGTVLSALAGHGRPVDVAIVREIRLPRALLGVLVGGALALSGASLQALLQNPLADPFLLGVSGGAACGTLLATILFPAAPAGGILLPAAGFVGALAAVLLVGMGATARGRLDRGRLLLAGVVVNALASAVLLFLLSWGDPARSRGFVFWMLGSLSGATGRSVVSLAPYVAVGFVVLVALARPLDALTLGEETAFTLGVEVERTKRVAYLAASLLAAAAVAEAGIIGFVGLLVPHAVRLLFRGHRLVLAFSFVAGAALLVGSDVAARALFAPGEISVGAVTALVGAPAFLLLLRRQG
jgi:iron complex transport system permease protein